MQFITTVNPLPVGKKVSVFTDHPEPVGEKIYFTDENGTLKNVARITHVGLSEDINVNNGRKYVVQAQVEEDASAQEESALGTRVYWT
jgi:hypothetical protein